MRVSMSKIAGIGVAALALLEGSRALGDDRFKVDVSLGSSDITGSYASFDPQASIPSIDLQGDLGISGGNSAFQARLWGRLSKHHRVQLDAFSVDDSGHASREVPVTILGVPFPVETLIDSTFKITYLRATYGFAPLATDRADLELQVGVEHLEASSTLTATDAILGVYSVSRNDSRTENGPVVGARLLLCPIKRLEIEGYVTYARLPISSTDITFDDVLVAGSFRIVKALWVRGGYRFVDVKVTDPDFNIDLSSRGPFLGASLRF